jgi:tripartite-type tricarboxylate transporter receptor subunit TctC
MKRFMQFILAAAVALPALAHAQQFPIAGKPLRIVVPFPPGGQTDIQARALAPKLSQSLGVPVVVENKPGASTIIGAQDVIRSAPDGHTLLYTISSTASQNPHLFAKLPYDPFRDLTPIMFAARSPTILIAPANAPFASVKELITYARANPGKVNYASFSPGSIAHLNGELLKQNAGIDIMHVPYKGTGDALLAVISGQVQLLFDGPTTAINNAKAGKVKMLAIADDRRYSVVPNVPTMSEAGVPGFEKVAGGMQFFGPRALPAAVVSKTNAELTKALRQPDVAKLFVDGGTELVTSSPEEHARVVKQLYDSYGALIRKLGVKLD